MNLPQGNKVPFWATMLTESQLLDAATFERLSKDAEVIEQDKHGLKVLKLSNGDILKIFRLKRIFSSAKIYSYARQFCRNALRLQVLGIPTVQVTQLYHFDDGIRTAVLYKPLAGLSIRQLLMTADAFDERAAYQLGEFIAELHQLGVYFRSLHFGNIILTSDNKFGLIDVADMSIFPWELGRGRRSRNFRHIIRNADDWAMFGNLRRLALIQGYEVLGHKFR